MKLEINIKKVDEVLKPKSELAALITLLIKVGLKRQKALELAASYPKEYLVRKYFECEYLKPRNFPGFFIKNVENDYLANELYHKWWKERREELMDSDLPQELKQIIGRI